MSFYIYLKSVCTYLKISSFYYGLKNSQNVSLFEKKILSLWCIMSSCVRLLDFNQGRLWVE